MLKKLMTPSVGIADFQGGVEEHVRALGRLGVSAIRVKYPEQLHGLTHFILPGGESTVIGRYLQSSGLDEVLRQRFAAGDLALFGTCAGAILLGDSDSEYSLGLTHVKLQRNGYGRQIDSFQKRLVAPAPGSGELVDFEAVFIRAPIITEVGEKVEVLSYDGDMPVLCRENRVLLSTFHPELTDDTLVHQYFLEKFSF